jgi:chromatin structure-remodeling complex protein RSC7
VEDDIIANAMSQMQPQGRPPVHDREPNKTTLSLAPFYTLGGPTTHFAGSGADPWSEAGWGNKRGRLRGQGVSEEDWMLRTAEESRKVDERLREYREERLVRLEGKDARRWVFATQKWTEEGEEERSAFEGDGDRRDGDVEVDAEGEADGEEGAVAATLKPPPAMGSKRSALSQEVTFKAEDEEMAFHPAEATQDEPGGDGDGEVAADNGVVRTEGGKIVVQSAEEEEAARSRWNWGLGSWESGVVLATYEVSRSVFEDTKGIGNPADGFDTASHAYPACTAPHPTLLGQPMEALPAPHTLEPGGRETQEFRPVEYHRSGRPGVGERGVRPRASGGGARA